MLISFCSCSNYKVVERYDAFTDITSKQMTGNGLYKIDADDNDRYIDFDIAKDDDLRNTSEFYAYVTYAGSDWLFINSDDPYIILLDSERLLPDSRTYSIERVVGSHAIVYETFVIPISKRDLEKIANSKYARIKINGSNGSARRSFGPVNKKRILDFIRQ